MADKNETPVPQPNELGLQKPEAGTDSATHRVDTQTGLRVGEKLFGWGHDFELLALSSDSVTRLESGTIIHRTKVKLSEVDENGQKLESFNLELFSTRETPLTHPSAKNWLREQIESLAVNRMHWKELPLEEQESVQRKFWAKEGGYGAFQPYLQNQEMQRLYHSAVARMKEERENRGTSDL